MYMYIYIYIAYKYVSVPVLRRRVCVRACVRVCVRACACVRVCVRACVYVQGGKTFRNVGPADIIVTCFTICNSCNTILFPICYIFSSNCRHTAICQPLKYVSPTHHKDFFILQLMNGYGHAVQY